MTTIKYRRGVKVPSFTDDLYEIRVRQTLLGQEVVNLFYYKDVDTGDPITLDNINFTFKADVYDEMRTAQVTNAEGLDIRTRLVGGMNESVLSILGEDGIRPGATLNSFSAWGFKMNRRNIDVRNGSKRVAGLSETDVEGNLPSTPMNSILDDVAAAFAISLVLASGAILEPFIFRRGSFELGTYIGTLVADVVFRAVTSQVSRKARPE